MVRRAVDFTSHHRVLPGVLRPYAFLLLVLALAPRLALGPIAERAAYFFHEIKHFRAFEQLAQSHSLLPVVADVLGIFRPFAYGLLLALSLMSFRYNRLGDCAKTLVDHCASALNRLAAISRRFAVLEDRLRHFLRADAQLAVSLAQLGHRCGF